MSFRLTVLLGSCLFVVSFGFITPPLTRSARGPRGTRVLEPSTVLHVSIDDDVAANAPRPPSPAKKQKGSKGSAKKQWKTQNKSKGGGRNTYNNSNDASRNAFIQLNKKIIASDTAADVISLLATSTPDALTKTAGGGALNSVNFATSVHRIGRYLAYNHNDRAATLSDPKFALFMCSFAEALAGVDYTQPLSSLLADGDALKATTSTQIQFSTRERTNLVWALAKLRIVPPFSSVPLKDSAGIKQDLVRTSIQLRKEIVNSRINNDSAWIPTLSLLSAQLMDTVAFMMVELEKEASFNVQEMVNMLWAFAAAQRPSVAVFDRIGAILADELERSAEIPKPQEFSNTIWAFATAGYTGENQRRLLELVAGYLEKDPKWISSFKPQEVSNTAWGIANLLSSRRDTGEANSGTIEQEKEDFAAVTVLRCIARSLINRCDEFKSQEVSNTIWAFGTLGFGILADKRNINDFIILKSDDYEGDVALVDQALAAVASSVAGRLRVFKEQELNNLAHGCGRLGRCEPELFSRIASEFANRRGRVTGQDIGTTLWSFATTKFFDEKSFENMLSRLRMDAVQYWKPQEISNIAWAIGTAGIIPKYPKAFDVSLIPANERASFEEARKDPTTLAFAAVAKELLRRPQEFKTQELKDSLWGLSKSGIRHPLVFRSIAEYLVGRETDKVPEGKIHTGVGVEDFSSQEIANLCWAYAKQGQLASENSETLNGRMAVYCATAVDIGETLLKRFINCAAETNLANYGDFGRFTNTDLSNTMWAMATLGCRHDRFLEVTERQVLSRCQRYLSGKERSSLTIFRGQEICNFVWSLATLNNITPEVLDAVAPYIEQLCRDDDGNLSARSIAQYLNRQELGNIAWGCTVAGHYPPKLIRILMQGLVGEGDEQTAEYMDEIHGEKGGLSEHSVMTLLYLHYGMQLDSAVVEGAALPTNFPSGWGSCGQGELLDDESGISLTLTTSKVQLDVSAAFTRVGFDHVEEHIIPTGDMLRMDLLSLDIADPSRKVGIEVDGPSHFYHNLDRWSPQDPPKGQVRVSGRKVEYDFDWDADRNNPNGSTSLKDRLLAKLGWKIIHIPFWEWYPMKGDKQAEDEYCRKLLEQI